MADKQELIAELEDKFKGMSKKLKLKHSLEDFDRIFFVRDFILQHGFVSESLSRMFCSRIVSLYESWANYLQGILMPNPSSLIHMYGSNSFSKQEKAGIASLINDMMALVSRNSLIGLTKDRKAEARFLDDAVVLWDTFFKEKLIEIEKKANVFWVDKSKNERVN